MRIGFLLVLLLAASPIPAWAQDGLPRLAPSALPARLMPAPGWTARDPIALDLRRNRDEAIAFGAALGAVIGAVVGTHVANHHVCNVPGGGEGDVEGMCKAAGLGFGILVGGMVGGLTGFAIASPKTR